MSSAAATAARSVFRSTAARIATASRLSAGAGAKARPASSPFRIPKQNPLANRIFRSPVELSCCVETMLPYHTATASALLTSMLSVSRRYGWTPEGPSWMRKDPQTIATMMYDECQRIRAKF